MRLDILYSFSLKAGDTEVRVINVGCSVKDILVPDKAGKVTDVCLAYADLKSKVARYCVFQSWGSGWGGGGVWSGIL